MTSDAWVEVTCPKCNGEQAHPEPGWEMHPDSFIYVPCSVCKGYGRMLATPIREIKPIVQSQGS